MSPLTADNEYRSDSAVAKREHRRMCARTSRMRRKRFDLIARQRAGQLAQRDLRLDPFDKSERLATRVKLHRYTHV